MADAKSGISIKFKQDKETKNTIRFAEQVEGDNEPVIGTLYLKKEQALELGESIEVKVTAA